MLVAVTTASGMAAREESVTTPVNCAGTVWAQTEGSATPKSSISAKTWLMILISAVKVNIGVKYLSIRGTKCEDKALSRLFSSEYDLTQRIFVSANNRL